MDDVVRKFLFSLVFLVVSSVITYVLGTWGSGSGPEDGHEAQVASAVVDPKSIKETFASVGGLERIKAEIVANVVTPLRYAGAFFHPRLKALHVPRGILFTGPPGCGKTLLARAIAKECNCSFVAVTSSLVEDKYFGETSKRIDAIFALARKRAPCILFFDEFDGLMRARSSEDQGCQYSLKTQLLSQMDGFVQASAAVIVIACTNSSAALDPAVRRRLPRVFTIGLPTEAERRHILSLHARAEKLDAETLEWLARATPGFSGSDLLELYRAAASLRIQRECQRPDFHVRAAAACAHPEARLADFAKSIRPLSRDEWRGALAQLGVSRTPQDYLQPEEAPPP